MTASLDTAPVRHGEELDLPRLAEYLPGKLDGTSDHLSLDQFAGGHSNLTYLLRAGSREYVLRRAPLGPVPPKAHDMAREFRVLRAVHPVYSPAPEPFVLCEDTSVIGAVFFIMERRRGTILRSEIPPHFAAIPDLGARASGAFLDNLIAMQAIDVSREPLSTLGKPEGFLKRQVAGWADRWQHSKTETYPEMDTVVRWLGNAMPVSATPSLVHNDYKLDNLMFDSHDPGRIVAVLDWEMATLGDPLADLGLALCYWTVSNGAEPNFVNTSSGWYSREELIERYAATTGRDVSRIGYYEVLGVFKLAVILQQIYFRYVRGQTRDERFQHFDGRVRNLVDEAVARVERL